MAGNVLTRKIGPLPMWAWTAIGGGGVLLWAVLARRKSGSGQGTSATAASPVTSALGATGSSAVTPPADGTASPGSSFDPGGYGGTTTTGDGSTGGSPDTGTGSGSTGNSSTSAAGAAATGNAAGGTTPPYEIFISQTGGAVTGGATTQAGGAQTASQSVGSTPPAVHSRVAPRPPAAAPAVPPPSAPAGS